MLKKMQYRLEVLKKLNIFAFGVRRFFILNGLIVGANIIISLVTPRIYRVFVDEVIIGRNIGYFLYVVTGYLILYILDVFLSFLRNYSNNRLFNKTMFRMKHKLLSHYLALPLKEYEMRSVGDLKMIIDEDITKLSDFGGTQSLDYLKSLITAGVAAIIILMTEWKLALFSIIIIPITFYIDHKISQKEKELQKINRVNNQRWNSWLHTTIQGWKEIKALNLQKHQIRTFIKFAHNFAEYFARWINFWVIRVLVMPKIKDEFLMKFSLYFFGGLLIMKGSITIGELLVFAMYYDLLSGNIRSVSTADAELQSNMPFYDRVMHELDKKPVVAAKYHIPANSRSDISMMDVQFSYGIDLPLVIDNFSLEIAQGERVAITGRSGSGKTTVLKLITGLLSASSGRILFSGIDINKISSKSLYSKIGFVLQENLLFNTTISDNLRLACPGASLEMLDEACKKACIYDFINEQPLKYDTVIGEKGIKLSGGQRQRLVLARLFLRNVDVLIFDEATSSIDQYSESVIHDTVNSIGRDKTIIVVAHRESSIALCDRVVGLSNL